MKTVKFGVEYKEKASRLELFIRILYMFRPNANMIATTKSLPTVSAIVSMLTEPKSSFKPDE